MHAERSDSPVLDVITQYERVAMMVLLDSEHGPRSRAELEREISGVNGNPVDVTDAIDNLYASRLVHLSGELVSVKRAARRMGELRL